ncbi:MAG: hypothetical protein IPP83_08965 [Flavobacteriales bacterium]|nr:hypothetical protein [Flavobacteriales bacterium]
MKRIVAKEFLLLVGCVVLVLLTALAGWTRNAWLSQRIGRTMSERSEQAEVLDALRAASDSASHIFIELFDTAFVHEHPDVFIGHLPWHNGSGMYSMDDFLSDFSRIYLACLSSALEMEGYFTQQKIKELKRVLPAENPRHDPPLEVARNNVSTFRGTTTEVETSDGTVLGFPPSMARHDIADVMGMLYPNPTKGSPRILIHREILVPSRSRHGGLLNALMRNEHRDLGEIVTAAYSTLADPGSYQMSLAFSKTVMHESPAHEELRSAYNHLVKRNILICTFDELLYTLQRKPVPPTEEALAALEKQRAVVSGETRQGWLR